MLMCSAQLLVAELLCSLVCSLLIRFLPLTLAHTSELLYASMCSPVYRTALLAQTADNLLLQVASEWPACPTLYSCDCCSSLFIYKALYLLSSVVLKVVVWWCKCFFLVSCVIIPAVKLVISSSRIYWFPIFTTADGAFLHYC